jgi:hypothetical protein
MNEEEAALFVRDITHAMCCIAARGDGGVYSDDMGDKVFTIRQMVLEND